MIDKKLKRSYYNSMKTALNINSYKKDGFKKVCEVSVDEDNHWIYVNINKDIMFSEHRSWVYAIVEGNEIVKIGETGNPLGIACKYHDQPQIGTKCRLGRYKRLGGTDEYVRDELNETIQQGNQVSIWALECDMVFKDIRVQGKLSTTIITYHKDLELRYLDHIYAQTGSIPRLNKARK